MNSFIFTGDGGISMLLNGKPYTVDKSHVNFDRIVTALKAEAFAGIPALTDLTTSIEEYMRSNVKAGYVEVDGKAGKIFYNGKELNSTLVDRIMKMLREGFKITPLILYLKNLMENPSRTAVEELYLWHEVAGMPITEDGHFLAFKRVNDDFTSFRDSTTDNTPGTILEMPRNMVDDRRDNLCSYGFHFCSQSYLPHYSGGRGKVLVLKINPKDVVAIPSDYKNAKGRACRYEVLYELKSQDRLTVEVATPKTFSVSVTTDTGAKHTPTSSAAVTAPMTHAEVMKEAQANLDAIKAKALAPSGGLTSAGHMPPKLARNRRHQPLDYQGASYTAGYALGVSDARSGGSRQYNPGYTDYGTGYSDGFDDQTAFVGRIGNVIQAVAAMTTVAAPAGGKDPDYILAYKKGYTDGKQKTQLHHLSGCTDQFRYGYNDGYKDGRGHKARKHK